MTEIFTTGFATKTAEQFFEELKRARIRRLVDIRLNNTSQLAAFTKKADLPYFLRQIGEIAYVHEPLLAPTPELLDAYRKRHGNWEEYESGFLELMRERRIHEAIERQSFDHRSVLLCSEPTPEHCHRRLVAEYLASHWHDVDIVHL